MDITSKAMLVRLSISQWSARRLDREATQEVIASHNASQDAGRFNKLLVKLDAVKLYQRAANEARVFHYANTLPWGDDESRILPAANYFQYSEKMRGFRAAFEQAADEFVSAYPGLIERAKRDLNGLFRVEDYPGVGELRVKFRFSVAVNPVPASDDFRVSLSAGESDSIREEIERRVRASVDAAMRDAFNRLAEALRSVSRKLHDGDAIFRDSLIGNLRELCDVLPRLNLTADPALDAVVEEVRDSLAGLNPDLLRECEFDRKTAALKADSILAKMAAYCGA